jgi:MFS family permease
MAMSGHDAGGREKCVGLGEHAPAVSDAIALGAAAPSSPSFFKRTFISLDERPFRNLWFGMLFQRAGMQIQGMVLGYFVFDLTGSIGLLGVVMAANGLPTLFIGPIGGVLADRMEKKRIVQLGHGISLLLVLFLAVSVTTSSITWWHLLAAAIVHGSVLPLMMPARQSMIPMLVKKGRLMNAVSLNSTGMNFMGIAAPGLGGGIIVLMGVGGAYYLLIAVYAVAIYFTSLVPKLDEPSRAGTSMATDMVEGLRYTRTNTIILLLLVLGFSQIVLAMPIRLILPVFAKDIFNVGAGSLGLMVGAMSLGALLGSLVMAYLGTVKRRGLLLAGSGVAAGIVLIGFAALSEFAPVFWAAMGFMVLIGIMQSSRFTLQNVLILEYADPEFRGRMMSFNMMGWGLIPLGVLPLTTGAELIGLPQALGLMALLYTLVAGGIIALSPRLRRLT